MKKNTILHILFVLSIITLFVVLFLAPEETTPHMPEDLIHKDFFSMKKSDAESACLQCHRTDEGEVGVPLSEGHPPPNRCLFCH